MFWVLWLLPIVGGYTVMYGCPELCQCDNDETTRCQNAELSELPTGIDVNVSSGTVIKTSNADND